MAADLSRNSDQKQRNKPEPSVLEKCNIKFSNIHIAALREKAQACFLWTQSKSEAYWKKTPLTIDGVAQWDGPWTLVVAKPHPLTSLLREPHGGTR